MIADLGVRDTHIAQNMIAHIWCKHRGYINSDVDQEIFDGFGEIDFQDDPGDPEDEMLSIDIYGNEIPQLPKVVPSVPGAPDI